MRRRRTNCFLCFRKVCFLTFMYDWLWKVPFSNFRVSGEILIFSCACYYLKPHATDYLLDTSRVAIKTPCFLNKYRVIHVRNLCKRSSQRRIWISALPLIVMVAPQDVLYTWCNVYLFETTVIKCFLARNPSRSGRPFLHLTMWL